MQFTYPYNLREMLPLISPHIRETVETFLRKCKYHYNIDMRSAHNSGDLKDSLAHTVIFEDPNAPESNSFVGAIRWVYTSSHMYKIRVVTRTLQSRRGRDHERRMSVETSDGNRAIREALKNFTPITMAEIAVKSSAYPRSAIRDWVYEHNDSARLNVPTTDLITEIRNLVSQGATFVTAEFQRIADKAISAYEETKRREKMVAEKYFVKFNRDSTVSMMDEANTVLTYTRPEQLPMFIQEALSILRITRVTDVVPGVGAKVGDNEFWVVKFNEQKS